MRIIALLLVATIAHAQPDSLSPGQPANPTCWSAGPLAKCKTWVVTELVLEMPTLSTSTTREVPNTNPWILEDFPARFAFTLGMMVNRGPRHALGATASYVTTEMPARLELRYRNWIAPRTGIDATVGYVSGSAPDMKSWNPVPARGGTASVGISGTYIGADLRFEAVRAQGRWMRGTYVTTRIGGKAAPITAATGFAAMIGLMYLLLHGEAT